MAYFDLEGAAYHRYGVLVRRIVLPATALCLSRDGAGRWRCHHNAPFCVMERKLYVMGHIGMGLTLVFGGLLLWAGGWAHLIGRGWLHAKLVLVAGLVAYQIYCGRINRTFAAGNNRRSHKFYRFSMRCRVWP